MKQPPKNWRRAKEIQGLQARLQACINRDVTGSECTIDLSLAHKLVEVCEQARWTEQGHGND